MINQPPFGRLDSLNNVTGTTYASRKFLEGFRNGQTSILEIALARQKEIEKELKLLRSELEYLSWFKELHNTLKP